MDPILTVEHLVKEYPAPGRGAVVHAVNGVSFGVAAGECLALVGESGSGKTTVGRCVAGLLPVTSGQVLFKGYELEKLRRREMRSLRARIRVVFQEPYDSLDPRCTVGDVLAEAASAYASKDGHLRKRVVELARLVELSDRVLSRYPAQLSGGQLQAVGIARAMATNPEFLVLDEPTSLLDATARASVVSLLTRLQKEMGTAYLFISHDLMTVREMSQRVAIMYLGKIVECAPAEEIFTRPKHPYTAALMGSIVYADPGRARSGLRLRGEIPSAIRLPSGCAVHSRCPVAVAECGYTRVRLVDVGPDHSVACLRTAPVPEYGLSGSHTITSLEVPCEDRTHLYPQVPNSGVE